MRNSGSSTMELVSQTSSERVRLDPPPLPFFLPCLYASTASLRADWQPGHAGRQIFIYGDEQHPSLFANDVRPRSCLLSLAQRASLANPSIRFVRSPPHPSSLPSVDWHRHRPTTTPSTPFPLKTNPPTSTPEAQSSPSAVSKTSEPSSFSLLDCCSSSPVIRC